MGKRILIVDDDSKIASSIEFLLRREGHDVEVVTRASDALECVEAFWPELALVATRLPDRSGYECCAALRAIPTDAPPHLVLVASVVDESVLALGRAAGADDFVQYPFVTLDLLSRLRPILEN
jgi:DNA-binding response OmpR family regulator